MSFIQISLLIDSSLHNTIKIAVDKIEHLLRADTQSIRLTHMASVLLYAGDQTPAVYFFFMAHSVPWICVHICRDARQ